MAIERTSFALADEFREFLAAAGLSATPHTDAQKLWKRERWRVGPVGEISQRGGIHVIGFIVNVTIGRYIAGDQEQQQGHQNGDRKKVLHGSGRASPNLECETQAASDRDTVRIVRCPRRPTPKRPAFTT